MPTALGSLWDMYELNASAFQEAITVLTQAITMVDGRQRPAQFAKMTAENCNAVIDNITGLGKAIQSLNVPVTRQTAVELLKTMQSEELTFMQCANLLLALAHTLRRELLTVKVFALDADRAKFYSPPEPLFGPEVDRKFLTTAYDIEQGGKCYACDLTTAAAFHWIRSLEAGIRAMARCLGIPDPTSGKDRNWSNVSKSLKDEIDRRWPASTGRMSGDAYLFDKLYGSIAGMQNPYRNETMHFGEKYTAPEALHIFGLVKGLMQRIASKMDENGLPKV